MSGGDDLRDLLADLRNSVHVPAVGGAVVDRDGSLEVEVIGKRRRGDSALATVGDQWHIGSCAKAITAALYARLVERGDAEWGVPIGEFFPDLADNVDSGWSTPTIDEVLVCRSGMRADLSQPEMQAAWDDTSSSTEQRTRAAVSALSGPPDQRGTFRYSNLGYIVVGAAIDRITEIPFEDALHTHLLEPLGITSAGFGPPPDIWGHKQKTRFGRVSVGRGAPSAPEDIRSDNPAVYTPAGRLHLTLADWARFQQLFLGKGGSLLTPATIDHLLTEPIAKDKGMTMGWGEAPKIGGASYAMQGSNTFWVATAIVDAASERTAMVVVNDGRTRLLRKTAELAIEILQRS